VVNLAPVPEFPRRLVYLGTPEMAVPPLQALVAAGFEIPLVITRIDKRRGRGSELSPSPVKAAALELGLPVSHRVDDAVDVGADLAVVVAFGQLIKPHVLERLAMVNIHFSLLPRWRGAAPVERALLAGDAETGTCLMHLEEGLDTGAVFDQRTVTIGATETAASLRSRLVDLGTEQLVECLHAGLRDPRPQAGEASYASKISPDELRLDWHRPAVELDRLVRLGGAWTTLRAKRLKIHAAELTDDTITPGRIDGLSIGTGTTALRLLSVQPEGKPLMDARSWANGIRPTTEDVFGE
jgi:methionyl-tRNA formyltransferase